VECDIPVTLISSRSSAGGLLELVSSAPRNQSLSACHGCLEEFASMIPNLESSWLNQSDLSNAQAALLSGASSTQRCCALILGPARVRQHSSWKRCAHNVLKALMLGQQRGCSTYTFCLLLRLCQAHCVDQEEAGWGPSQCSSYVSKTRRATSARSTANLAPFCATQAARRAALRAPSCGTRAHRSSAPPPTMPTARRAGSTPL
jgi:hypothetical protein